MTERAVLKPQGMGGEAISQADGTDFDLSLFPSLPRSWRSENSWASLVLRAPKPPLGPSTVGKAQIREWGSHLKRQRSLLPSHSLLPCRPTPAAPGLVPLLQASSCAVSEHRIRPRPKKCILPPALSQSLGGEAGEAVQKQREGSISGNRQCLLPSGCSKGNYNRSSVSSVPSTHPAYPLPAHAQPSHTHHLLRARAAREARVQRLYLHLDHHAATTAAPGFQLAPGQLQGHARLRAGPAALLHILLLRVAARLGGIQAEPNSVKGKETA